MSEPHQPAKDVESILRAHKDGDPDAFAQLVEVVYPQLKAVATNRLNEAYGQHAPEVTMQVTALVNETVLYLMEQRNGWVNREQFFAIATCLMRRALVDYQRHRLAAKRGGGHRGTALDEDLTGSVGSMLKTSTEIGFKTMELIQDLHELDARKAEVATLHLKCGKSLREIANMVGYSLPTIERDWRFVRAWLGRELKAAGFEVE